MGDAAGVAASASEKSAELGHSEGFLDLNRRLAVPMSVMVMVAVGIALALVIVWAAGYRVGSGQARDAAARDLAATEGLAAEQAARGGSIFQGLSLTPGLVREDPTRTIGPTGPIGAMGATGTAGSDSTGPRPRSGRETDADRGEPSRKADGSPGDGTVGGVAAAELRRDTRQTGLNYLVVASQLDVDEAERTAAFLTRSGVPAFIVAERVAAGGSVDRGRAAGNNPGLFRIYSRQGITRDEYRSRAAVRIDLEQTVQRLGQVWRREHRGRSDLAQVNWEKYAP